jgi:hypothetical protein
MAGSEEDREIEYWRQSGVYARTCGVPLAIMQHFTPVSQSERRHSDRWSRCMAAFEDGWIEEDRLRQERGAAPP